MGSGDTSSVVAGRNTAIPEGHSLVGKGKPGGESKFMAKKDERPLRDCELIVSRGVPQAGTL